MRTQSSRIDGLGTTIFARMSALAAATGAVNLGQGFPDTDGPDVVREAAVEALRGGANQYAPGVGVPALREAVAEHQRRWYGLDVDPDTEVVVTTGATEAIAAAVLGIVEPGDEVVVLEPYYDSYVAVLQMAGAVRRPVTLRAPDFRLPLEQLRAAVTPRTTAILLNTPHNPTGTVLTPDELAAVAQVAREHDLVVISDEVYEHLTFDVPHVPIATLPGMWERTLTISSGGKTFSFTGWKVGWASGPAPLVASVLGAKQFLTFTSGVAAAARRRRGPAARRRLLRGLPRGDARTSRPALRGAGRRRPRRRRARRHVLRHHRHPPARVRGRPRLLPAPARAGRGRRRPPPGVPRPRHPPRGQPRPPLRPVGVLQASRGDRRGRASARVAAGLTVYHGPVVNVVLPREACLGGTGSTTGPW
ncbi:histidinol-phosphate/aromatic aminotransferase/cobyric acid decarboxylase-like protein [Aeromicrobium sp. SORGH_AS981]|nr:histidinol-phosphate/aromatic aminotransferase/cobyric acid decarboxylase-like protein [Aeromicrobium sp. SORGH_AS_0981]